MPRTAMDSRGCFARSGVIQAQARPAPQMPGGQGVAGSNPVVPTVSGVSTGQSLWKPLFYARDAFSEVKHAAVGPLDSGDFADAATEAGQAHGRPVDYVE
ncbi:hypothetical protein GCM10009765_44320 [Fodinicola feengrottensis]|uniref:Uncharacterized protein n=1 Tax=Fodinicola feengrottensis TaxID=435914 RepID=A0ABN2HM17_9ACTN